MNTSHRPLYINHMLPAEAPYYTYQAVNLTLIRNSSDTEVMVLLTSGAIPSPANEDNPAPASPQSTGFSLKETITCASRFPLSCHRRLVLD